MVKILFLLLIIGIPLYIFLKPNIPIQTSVQTTIQYPSLIPSPTPSSPPRPSSKILPGGVHVFQTFNNCGPAALSMALSLYGINVTQAQLGQELRPYQIPNGDNDDKSVTLEELAEKSREYNFTPYHRPNGDLDLIRKFIASDIPVITRTLTKQDEDIGHYRIVKGYDDSSLQLIQDDSLQGKNLWYSYNDFNSLWKQFNFEYLVLVPEGKKQIAENILGEDIDEKIAWEKAVKNSRSQLIQNPDDVSTRFNLSVALYHIGDYKASVEEFEKIENQLPFRTLWYQIEPVQSYYALGNYEQSSTAYNRVFEITDRILNYHNRAFSELYLIRGEIHRKQGNLEAAKGEFEKAVFYNRNLTSAKEALNSLN